jgi:hypothetical protein
MKVTLQRVQNKAIADPAFFKQLRTDLDRALERNKMELSAGDYRRLKGILALDGQNITLDLGALMDRTRRVKAPGRGLFWMGFWDFPVKGTYTGIPAEGMPAKKLPL